MDAGTVVVAIVSSVLSGGLVGGLVALKVASRESSDRQAALDLEREKWEHERSANARQVARAACEQALSLLDECRELVTDLRGGTGLLEDRIGTDDPEARDIAKTAYDDLNSLISRWPTAMSALSGTFQDEALAAFTPAVGIAGEYVLAVLSGKYDADWMAAINSIGRAVQVIHLAMREL